MCNYMHCILLVVQWTIAAWAHRWIKRAGQLSAVRSLVLMLRNIKKCFPFLAAVIGFPYSRNQEKSCYTKVMSKYWPLPLWIPVALFPICCIPFFITASGSIHACLNKRANIRKETAQVKVHFYTNSVSELCWDRQGGLALQDVEPWNAGYEDTCWAVRPIAWHIRCCWSANQRNSQFCLWLAEIQEKDTGKVQACGFTAKVCDGEGSHAWDKNGWVCDNKTRMQHCLPRGDLHLYLLLWKTWDMKEQLWQIRDFQSANSHLCQGQQCSLLPRQWRLQTSHGTEESKLAPESLRSTPSPQACGSCRKKAWTCKQAEAQSPGMPWEQPWGSAELTPLQLCRWNCMRAHAGRVGQWPGYDFLSCGITLSSTSGPSVQQRHGSPKKRFPNLIGVVFASWWAAPPLADGSSRLYSCSCSYSSSSTEHGKNLKCKRMPNLWKKKTVSCCHQAACCCKTQFETFLCTASRQLEEWSSHWPKQGPGCKRILGAYMQADIPQDF